MPFLIAGMVFVGLLCAVDLLLTMAVIRRLREHTEQFAALQNGDPAQSLLREGTPLPAFDAESVDGETVNSQAAPPEVLALLSTECVVCLEEMPRFLRFLGDRGVDRSAAVVVIMGGDTPKAEKLVEGLRPVAQVVRQPWGGPIEKAFQARLFPNFYLASDGVVRVTSISVANLDRPVPA
ncbi:TlpA family protein disulfide reductase [Streptosporangium sp. CA-115845]|uniref:TlpA family protein disulfide reductase n=1 Tax=Streptosporangium sp. CA-115845 TaxID=3240071 RepID=UPI003D8A4456